MNFGVVDLGADAARLDLLHLPRGLARLVRSAWESEGGLTGLATVVLEPGRQQVANAVDAAAEGDFRTAASSGVKALTVGVSTGIAIGELGAAAVEAIGAGAKTLEPGPYAKESIPAHRGRPTAAEQRQVNELMDKHDCHTCGAKTPGTKSDNAVADHQPPQALDEPTRFYPHCINCQRRQGGQVLQEKIKRQKQ